MITLERKVPGFFFLFPIYLYMATITLTNDDLRAMIREAVERLCEGQWYEAEPLCRLPYFVSINFSDHAIDREDERDISQSMIIDNARRVVKQVIKDYEDKKLGPEDYFKIIDRENCVVAVCGISPSYNKKRIHQIVVVTCYVWDGRFNIDKGNNYYINEESPAYLEAKEWNEENQDKVISYMDWKRGTDVARQQKKAERDYYFRTHPQEPSREKRMNRLNAAFDSYERKKKYDIHDSLPDGDLKAIQDYFRDMNNKRIELEPLYEFVRRATKQALREAFGESTSKNPSTTKKTGKNGFYA